MNAPHTAPTADPDQQPLPRWLPRVVLWALVLYQLAPAVRIITMQPIFGDDHSSHLAVIRHLLVLLGSGQTDLFCPTYNLGFPMYLYYQPLPHLAVALVHIGSLAAIPAQLAFNLVVIALWCLYPIAVYRGLRALDLDELGALLAAICAPLCSSALPFGFTLNSVMALGLYTQTWAMLFFPLALGSGWRAIQPEAPPRAVFVAGGWLLLLCLCHAFYGLVLGTALTVAVLCRPTRILAGFTRLASLGVLTATSLAYWLLPLYHNRAFAGGWPWGGKDRWEGYGAARVAKELFSGQLFDQAQLPAITIGLLAGLGFAFWRFRRAPAARALAISFLLFVAFLIGRRSLGHLVDVQPANLGLQLFRYIGAVHFFGVALAGYGLAQLARFAHRRLGKIPAFALLVGLLASPLIGAQIRAHGLFRTLHDYNKVTKKELVELGKTLDMAGAKEARLSRVYAHNKVGTGTHLIAGLLAHYTKLPLGQSYGVGMHDSLGFYYLEYIEPKDLELLRFYGFRFALAAKDKPWAKARAAAQKPPLMSTRKLALYRLGGDIGLFSVGRAGWRLFGAPRTLRPAIKSWLRARHFARGHYGVVLPREGDAALEKRMGLSKLPALRMLRGTKAVERRQAKGGWKQTRQLWIGGPATDAATVGHVLVEKNPRPGRYETTVELKERALVVAKVSYHPFWRVEIDGRAAPVLQATPALLAVRVPAGRHRVVFRFENPVAQKALAGGAAALWLFAVVGLSVTGRRRQRPDSGP